MMPTMVTKSIILLPLILSMPRAQAQMFKPTRADHVLETLARKGPSTNLPPEFRAERLALLKDPQQLDLALRLGSELIKLGRRSSDPRYYGEAQAILKPWWAQKPPPIPVLLLRATILQFNHQFDEALQDLAIYLRAVPDDIQARLMEATVLQVLGRYDEAVRSCESLPTRRQITFRTLCIASARAYLEDPRPIYVNLLALTRQNPSQPATPFSLSTEDVYALGILTDIALQLNDVRTALQSLQSILTAQPWDVYAAVTLSDLLLDSRREQEAQAIACDNPDHDGLLLRCARAIRTSDPKRFAELTAILDQRFESERRRQSPAHLRELAYFRFFIKNEPSGALDAAVENFRVQKEPIDARLVLESATARRSKDRASAALRWMESTRYSYEKFTALKKALGD